MPPRPRADPHPAAHVPADVPAVAPAQTADAGGAEPAKEDVPSLRDILKRYTAQGTAAAQVARPVPAPATAPAEGTALKSLRSLFLDSTSDPTLGRLPRDDAWTRPAPPRRR